MVFFELVLYVLFKLLFKLLSNLLYILFIFYWGQQLGIHFSHFPPNS
jgi:hypothetical protein